MQSHRLQIIGFLSLFILSGCAAQQSYRDYERSKALFESAERMEPLHPRLDHARLALEAGYENLRAGQYSQAARRFRQVELASEEVLTWAEKERSSAIGSSSPPQAEPVPQATVTEAPEANRDLPKVKPDTSRMELPAQALAAYLARKKGQSPPPPKKPAKSEVKKEEVPQAKARTPEGALVIKAGSENEARRLSPPSEPVAVPSLNEMAEEEKPQEPAKPSAGQAPLESQADLKHDRQSVPGSLDFTDSELGLSLTVLDRLDQMSVFLLDNPSNTLILTGSKGPNEVDSTVRARFVAIQTYLMGKGVPEDQVRLDEEINSASTGQVVMSLIEH
jgi:hypothetical protein